MAALRTRLGWIVSWLAASAFYGSRSGLHLVPASRAGCQAGLVVWDIIFILIVIGAWYLIDMNRSFNTNWRPLA